MQKAWPGRLRARPLVTGARSLVARVLVLALLLPTGYSLTAPDPHWFLGLGTEAEQPAVPHHHPEGTPEHEHSAIPGSPGHPADHDCSPCQVLKYLAIYLPQLPFLLPAAAPVAFSRIARDQAQRAGHFASLPPSRAPPRTAA